MKGNEQIIKHLNMRLSEELAAVNQYMVHAEMCENWGYKRLHDMIFQRSIHEMKHAERLIARILFLEGIPIVSMLGNIHIGSDIQKMHSSDHDAEIIAIRGYNESIRVAGEVGDNGSRKFLESLLKEEEEHIDLIEAQLEQITQMGIANYLVEQIA